MSGKSDPSIYDDRTTIGSDDELDEYGVWVKTEPQDLSNSVPDIEELPDFDDPMLNDMEMPDFNSSLSDDLNIETEVPFDSDNIEFEEIPEYSELPEGPAPVSIDGDGFTEVSMSDFLDSPIDQKPSEGIDFGDLDSSVPEIESIDLEDDTIAFSAAPLERPPSGRESFSSGPADNKGGNDLSTQLLQRIADELSSIKKEISSLKSELSVVRGELKSPEGADGSGFFGEEEDEKIALTGDELDNILNTANFTEETGSGEGVEISFDEDLSELDGALKVENEVKGPVTDDFDISLDLSPEFSEDTSELDRLRDDGASPLTEAPDDTSYLEEDPLASPLEDTISEEIDFSEAIIDEPDLSSQVIDNAVSEPSIDNISIDLDMEDALTEMPSGSDDFLFETEDTVEIPIEELPQEIIPEINDTFSVIDSAEEDLLPETVTDIDFDEISPKDFDEPLTASTDDGIPNNLKHELKIVLSYMDQLLESLPEDKIEEFAQSEYFDTYKKLFEELGLV